MGKKTIAIDFDGVIHKYSKGWQEGEIYDEPMEGAIEGIVSLCNKGYRIVVFTTREDSKTMVDWWIKWYRKKFPDSEIPQIKFTNKKPPAIAYINDRAIRFINWRDILNYF